MEEFHKNESVVIKIDRFFKNFDQKIEEKLEKKYYVELKTLTEFILFLKKLSENGYVFNNNMNFDKQIIQKTLKHENAHALVADKYDLFKSFVIQCVALQDNNKITKNIINIGVEVERGTSKQDLEISLAPIYLEKEAIAELSSGEIIHSMKDLEEIFTEDFDKKALPIPQDLMDLYLALYFELRKRTS